MDHMHSESSLQFAENNNATPKAAEAETLSACGYIKRIDMRNFPTVAHGTHSVRLSPNRQKVTVLSGGSDKTAILLALAIEAALGVSLRRLRRRWEFVGGLDKVEDALIRLTFWNEGEGPYAFEPHRFGRQIIVERYLSCLGNIGRRNVLRMANEDGKVVASDEASLHRMLQHFRICGKDPLFWVDRRCMARVLQAHPETLYSLFLQAHLFDREGWDGRQREEADRQIQGNLSSSLQKTRAAKETKAGELRGKAKELQQQLENWETSIAELKLCFHLAKYRQHREELETKQKLLSQTQQQSEEAKGSIGSLKELQSIEQERRDNVASSLTVHRDCLSNLEESLKHTLKRKGVLEEELRQVQKDKNILAKETAKLELASRLAGRKGIVERRRATKGEAEKENGGGDEERAEPDSVKAAALRMALTFPQAVLVGDHRKACKQSSKQRRRERALLRRLGTLESAVVDCEADIDKHSLLAKGCTEELGRITATVGKIQLKLRTAEDELKQIGNRSSELKATVESLKQRCCESLLVARQFVSLDDDDTNKGTDNSSSKVDQELMMLLENGVATTDPSVYEAKLKFATNRNKAEIANAYCSILSRVDEISEEIREIQKEEEIELEKKYKLLRQQELDRRTKATDGWFQHFLAGFYGSGRLVFDHQHSKLYMKGVVPSNAMFWAQSYLFALLGSAGPPLCMFNCDHCVAEVYRPFFLNTLITNALQLDCQSLFVTNQDYDAAAATMHRYDSRLHIVSLHEMVETTTLRRHLKNQSDKLQHAD